ncbi:3454_t:CDS:2, partial [Dentiscutata heterogama]
RSMPANLGHRTNLLNEEEQANSNTSMQIPTIEENDHHILDLLLNESFSEVELGLDQPLTKYTSEEKNSSSNNNDIETIDQSREIIDDLQDLEESLVSNEKEEINNVLISQR